MTVLLYITSVPHHGCLLFGHCLALAVSQKSAECKYNIYWLWMLQPFGLFTYSSLFCTISYVWLRLVTLFRPAFLSADLDTSDFLFPATLTRVCVAYFQLDVPRNTSQPPWWHPFKIYKPPQLAPFYTKEQRLCLVVSLTDDWASHPITRGDTSHSPKSHDPTSHDHR